MLIKQREWDEFISEIPGESIEDSSSSGGHLCVNGFELQQTLEDVDIFLAAEREL